MQQSLAASQAKVSGAESTYDDDPVRWIETHFYIPETNAPINLQPYQRAVLKEALRKDVDGNFIYSLIVWSDLKKSAKSTMAAAITLYLAWHNDWETARIVGNDLKQADSRTFFYIKRAILLNPILSQYCTIKNFQIKINHRNTTISAIPVDPKGEAGGGDLIVCFTELWAAKNEAAKQLWSETTLSPLKYGKSLRLAESYAGFEGASPILEQLYESGVKNGRLIDLGIPGLEVYVNESARQLTLWNTVPRCPWQTEDYYRQEAATLLPSEFRRIHRNQWGANNEAFVPLEWWDACKALIDPLRTKQSVVLALDAAVDSDCFAITMLSVRVLNGERIPQVRYARIWTPPKGGKITFSNPLDPLDTKTPEGELRRLCKSHNVVCVAYDPYQLHDMATRLSAEGIAFMEPFNQNQPRLIADKRLHDLIRDRRIEHGGEVDLREHIQNANRKTEDKYLRIVKRKPELKIDLAVALSMATDRALYYNL